MMFRFSLLLTALQVKRLFSPLSAVGRTNQARPIISHDRRILVNSTDAAADGKKKRRRKQPPGSINEHGSFHASLEKVEALEDEDDIEDMT
jgi:hypothetical protein